MKKKEKSENYIVFIEKLSSLTELKENPFLLNKIINLTMEFEESEKEFYELQNKAFLNYLKDRNDSNIEIDEKYEEVWRQFGIAIDRHELSSNKKKRKW